MKHRLLLILILLVLHLEGSAQTLSRTNVAKISLRGSGTIFLDDQVKGYYTFYGLEKKDKNNNNYQLSIFDENLREINSITITRPKYYVVVDGAFNGSAFCFLFYDTKSKSVELISYDRTLAQLGSFTQNIAKNKYAIANYSAIAQGGSLAQAYLIGVKEKGFVYYGLTHGDLKYQIDFFNNNMKRVWSEIAVAGKQIEVASEGFQQDHYLGTLITKKKSASSKDIEVDLLVQEAESGRKLFRVPVGTAQFSVTFSDVYYDSAKENFIVFGEYYDKKDKELKAQSLGFICITYDMQGNVISEKTNSWAADISRVTPVNEKGRFDGSNTSILFHDIIRTSDGQFFAVGEQYKKTASGAGVALQALNVFSALLTGVYSSNPGSSAQMNIYNLVIFQFNPDFKINKVHIFEKDKNVVLLPSGAGFTSSKQLSFYVKAVGGFDYKYTQESSNKETFVVTYINYDREQGQKSTNMLGSVIYTPEKTFVVDKLKLNRSSSDYFISRAKEGYVLVTEYFKKEKRLDSRLEKLNY
jgi:hypothetical protein